MNPRIARDPMKLIVRNLPRPMTEAELRTMFEAHGTVQSCNLVLDAITGGSKGFGFVEMPKPGEAKAAMKSINGKEVDGNRIRVKKAEARKPESKGTGTKETQQKQEQPEKTDASKNTGHSVWGKFK